MINASALDADNRPAIYCVGYRIKLNFQERQ